MQSPMLVAARWVWSPNIHDRKRVKEVVSCDMQTQSLCTAIQAREDPERSVWCLYHHNHMAQH